jgi:1-acyl-sn-glycerol-3-phosphate acyltransferase
MNVVGKKIWRGGEKLPKTGKIIVASNHLSYLDVLFLTHFLFRNGRAPRYIGKEGVFKVPVIGKIILAAGMVPVARESKDASKALIMR